MDIPFKLSPKQLEAYQNSKKRLVFYIGAVRSGKSYVSLLRLLRGLFDTPRGDIAICGRTERTIFRNVINPLYEIVGDNLRYCIGRGIVNIYGRELHVISASDARAENKIRGCTLAMLYIDEASLIPEDFIKMGLSRLSLPGSFMIATSNPDSEYCYIKKELIDRKDELDIAVFNFTLDDNPVLSEEYKRNIKKEYTGLYYRRFILGEFCQAEGAVYDFFDKNIHVIKHPPGPATKYIVGIDYGTTNPCAFVLVGINRSLYPNIWVEKEYYYDSKKQLRQKTDTEYAHDLKDFLQGIHPEAIYIDPSAASFKQELFRQLYSYNIVDADNSVLDGIRFVSNLLSNGTLKICENCPNLIMEMGSYSWDEKANKTGVDKVRKEFDHLCDSLRYCIYTHLYNFPEKDSMTERDAINLEKKYGMYYR